MGASVLPDNIAYDRGIPMVQSAHREAIGYFEPALSAFRHLPEQRATALLEELAG